MARRNVDETVAVIRSRTDGPEAGGESKFGIISIAYACLGVMPAKRVDRGHAISLARRTLREPERRDGDAGNGDAGNMEEAVAGLRGMAALMKRIAGDGAGTAARRAGALVRKKRIALVGKRRTRKKGGTAAGAGTED